VNCRVIYPCLLFFSLFATPWLAWAQDAPWPEPLTLEFALGLAVADHPQLQMAAAEIDRARAEQSRADADNGLAATLSARLRWIDPPAVAIDQSQDDHQISLLLNKPLYDFGRTTAREAATQAAVNGSELNYRDAIERHRIAIMAAFFDVLLADQAYARDTEEMSMTYVRFDRAQQRNELGQLSDIEMLEKRSEFQASRVRQARSQSLQRTTRARLANLLNHPEHLPSDLVQPQLDLAERKLPEEVDTWYGRMEQANPVLLALKAQQESVQAQLNLARATDNPLLTGQVEVADYSRISGSNDKWRAGVTLDVPLFDGGRSGSLQAERRAELRKVQASLEQQRRDLRQRLLEVWTELQTLQVSKQRLDIEQQYRDLYLDRSRALYELEVATDLGDSMVRMSALRYRIMQMRFSTALAWARVDALLGQASAATAQPAAVNETSQRQ
jgi:outer membrane protein TolC